MSAHRLELSLPPDVLEAIAQRAAELLLEQRSATTDRSPWRTVDEAADYLRCSSRQRIYDLVHEGKLKPRRDGKRLLFHRNDDLDAYLEKRAA